MSAEVHTLSIVIPAYNKEKAIGLIIERCLAERERIVAETGVEGVEILVVDDGSRDRTAEVARGYADVRLISYRGNQGYGAALKRGFEEGRGTLVSFLDAAGVCDPGDFIPLVNGLLAEGADVAVGSRLGPGSEMPRIQRLANRIYTVLINALTRARVTDSASSMRVIRRSALGRLYPLPDGQHFAPAMTARAVSSHSLKLIEVPIAYTERVGESKLSLVRGGVRFLKVIMDIILSTRPLRFFVYVAALALGIALVLLVRPVTYYFAYGQVPDWMVYRLIAVVVLVLMSLAVMTVGIVADQVAELMNADVRRRRPRAIEQFVRAVLSQRVLIVAGPILVLVGLAINWKGLWQFVVEGRVEVPWVFPVTGAFFVLMGVWSWGLGMLQRIVRTLRLREEARVPRRDSWGRNGWMSTPGELPFVSVIIPARNEETNIRACLESLGALDYPADRYEVIIADAMSTDGTREVAESFGAIVVPNEGLYVANGRHVGFEHSKGELIAFSDADCVMDRAWLRDAVKYFDDSTVGGISGPTLVSPGETRFGRGVAWVFTLAVAGGISCQADTVKGVREVTDLPGANCIYRREVIEQAMPLATGLVAGEDVEMNWHIRKHGWRLLHVPDAQLWHYKRPSPKQFARQVYRFGVTRCQCAKISWEMLSPLHMLVAAWIPLVIAAIVLLARFAPMALAYGAIAAGAALAGLLIGAWATTKSPASAVNAVFALAIILVAWPVGFLQEIVFPARYFREHSDWLKTRK